MEKPTVYQILNKPDDYFTREKGEYMPPWKGILLAWLIKELRKPEDLFRIECIRTFWKKGYKYYEFHPEDFIFETECEYDEIEVLHRIGLDRFEMIGGGFYKFVQTDGEYHQDRLDYHSPVDKDKALRKDFDLLLESVKK